MDLSSNFAECESLNDRVLRLAKKLKAKNQRKDHWMFTWSGDQVIVFLEHFNIKFNNPQIINQVSGEKFLSICIDEAILLFGNANASMRRNSELSKLIPSSIQQKKAIRLLLLHEQAPDGGLAQSRRHDKREHRPQPTTRTGRPTHHANHHSTSNYTRTSSKSSPKLNNIISPQRSPSQWSENIPKLSSYGSNHAWQSPKQHQKPIQRAARRANSPRVNLAVNTSPTARQHRNSTINTQVDEIEVQLLEAILSKYRGNFERRFAPRVFHQLADEEIGEITVASMQLALSRYLDTQCPKRSTIVALVQSWSDSCTETVPFDEFFRNVLVRNGILPSPEDDSKPEWYEAYESVLSTDLIQTLLNTASRLPRIQEWFYQYDPNNDGIVSVDGFRAALELMGMQLSTHQLDKLCMCFLNHDTQVGVDYLLFSEFLQVGLERYQQENVTKVAYQHFQTKIRPTIQTQLHHGTAVPLQPPPLVTTHGKFTSTNQHTHPASSDTRENSHASHQSVHNSINDIVNALQQNLVTESHDDNNFEMGIGVQQQSFLPSSPAQKCRLKVLLGQQRVVKALHDIRQVLVREEHNRGRSHSVEVETAQSATDQVLNMAEQYFQTHEHVDFQPLKVYVVLTSCAVSFNPPRFQLEVDHSVQSIQVQAKLKHEPSVLSCPGCLHCTLKPRRDSLSRHSDRYTAATDTQVARGIIHVFVGPLEIASIPIQLALHLSDDSFYLGVTSPLSVGSLGNDFHGAVRSTFLPIKGDIIAVGCESEWIRAGLAQALTELRKSKISQIYVSQLDMSRSNKFTRDRVSDASDIVLMWNTSTVVSSQMRLVLDTLQSLAEQEIPDLEDAGNRDSIMHLPLVKLVYWEHPKPEIPPQLSLYSKINKLSIVFHSAWQLERSGAPMMASNNEIPFSGLGVPKVITQTSIKKNGAPHSSSEQNVWPTPKPGKPVVVLRKGDRVFARCGRQAKFSPGIISQTHQDGTFDVAYDNGEVELQVRSRYIRKAEPVENLQRLQQKGPNIRVNAVHREHLKWGTKVQVPDIEGCPEWGRVSNYSPTSNRYRVVLNQGGEVWVPAKRTIPESKKELLPNNAQISSTRTYADAMADHLISLVKNAARIDPMGTNLRVQFERLDVSGTGKISYRDLQIGVQKIGFQATPEELHEIMDRIDRNHDGFIDYSEFVRFALPNGIPEHETKEAKERDLRSQLPQRLKGLEELVENLRSQMQGIGHVWDTFRYFDTNNNGELDEKEFRAAVSLCGFELSPRQADQLMKALDFDSNGAIAYKEFVTFLEGYNASFLIHGNNTPARSAEGASPRSSIELLDTSDSDSEPVSETSKSSSKLSSRELKERKLIRNERKRRLRMEHKAASKVQAVVRGYHDRKRTAVQSAQLFQQNQLEMRGKQADRISVASNLTSRHWMLCGQKPVNDTESTVPFGNKQSTKCNEKRILKSKQQLLPHDESTEPISMKTIVNDNQRIEKLLERVRTILQRNSRGGAKITSLFRFMDRDMDGFVGMDDLSHSLHRFGVSVDEQSVRRVICCYDFDCDEMLASDEFGSLVEGGVSRVKEESKREQSFISYVEKLGAAFFHKLEQYSQFLATKTANPPNLVALICPLDRNQNGSVIFDELVAVLQRLGYQLLPHEKKILLETFGSRISDTINYREFLCMLLCRNYGHLVELLNRDIDKALGKDTSECREGEKEQEHLRKCLERIAVFAMQQQPNGGNGAQTSNNTKINKGGSTKSKYLSPKERCRQYLTELLMRKSKSISTSEFAKVLILCSKSKKLCRVEDSEAQAIAIHFSDSEGGLEMVPVSSFIDYVCLVAGRFGALGKKKNGKRGEVDPSEFLNSPRGKEKHTSSKHLENTSSVSVVLESMSENDRRLFGALSTRLNSDMRVKATSRENQLTKMLASSGSSLNTTNMFGPTGFQRKVGTASSRRDAANVILADYMLSNGALIDKTELELVLSRLGVSMTGSEIQLLCRVIAIIPHGIGISQSAVGGASGAAQQQQTTFDLAALAEVLGTDPKQVFESWNKSSNNKSHTRRLGGSMAPTNSVKQEEVLTSATMARISRGKSGSNLGAARTVGFEAFHAQVKENLGPNLGDKVQDAIVAMLRNGRISLGSRKWFLGKQNQTNRHTFGGSSQHLNFSARNTNARLQKKPLVQSLIESGIVLNERELGSLVDALEPDKNGSIFVGYLVDFVVACVVLNDRAKLVDAQTTARQRVRKIAEKLVGIIQQTDKTKRFRFLQTFKAMDHSDDGFISGEELRATLLSIGLKVEEDDHRRILDAFDSNHDGRINYREFVQFVDSMEGAANNGETPVDPATLVKRILHQPVVQQLVLQLSSVTTYQFYNWLPLLRKYGEGGHGKKTSHLVDTPALFELLQQLGVAMSKPEVGTFLHHVFDNQTDGNVPKPSMIRMSISKHTVEPVLTELFRESKRTTAGTTPLNGQTSRTLFHDHQISGSIAPNTPILLVSGPQHAKLHGGVHRGRGMIPLPGRIAQVRSGSSRYDLLMNSGKMVPNVERRHLLLDGPNVRNEFAVGSKVCVDIPANFAGAGTYHGKIVREHAHSNLFDVSVTCLNGKRSNRGAQKSTVLQKIPGNFLRPLAEQLVDPNEPFRVDSRVVIYGTEVEAVESVFSGVDSKAGSHTRFIRGIVAQVQPDGRFTIEFEHGETVSNIGLSELRA